MASNNNLWVWGYVLPEVPGPMLWVYRHNTYCSLETGAQYLGADNVVFMDSCTSRSNLNETLFSHVSGAKQVLCGLEHDHYAECAKMVSEFSLTHPQITGALIDDFRDPPGPSGKMTVADLKEVYEALKSANPKLKLYLVRYHMRQNYDELIPFQDYFDGLNVWCWNSTDHFWKAMHKYDLLDCQTKLPGKEILQGQFIHDFGTDYALPMPLDQVKLQCEKIGDRFREGMVDGWVILQNGYFGCNDHREQMQYLKNHLDWFYGTFTRR